jgi:hypothetical protein
MYAHPLILAIKAKNRSIGTNFVLPWAVTAGQIFHRLKKSSQITDYKRVNLDFSAFDATINSELISIFFDVVREMYGDWPTVTKDLDAIKDCMNNSKIILPDGFVYQKNHGVSSGST